MHKIDLVLKSSFIIKENSWNVAIILNETFKFFDQKRFKFEKVKILSIWSFYYNQKMFPCNFISSLFFPNRPDCGSFP